MNWDHFSRHAYAFIDPTTTNPRVILRRGLLSDTIPNGDILRIQPSSLGTDVVVFAR